MAEAEQASAQIIDGKAIAATIKEELKKRVSELNQKFGKVRALIADLASPVSKLKVQHTSLLLLPGRHLGSRSSWSAVEATRRHMFGVRRRPARRWASSPSAGIFQRTSAKRSFSRCDISAKMLASVQPSYRRLGSTVREVSCIETSDWLCASLGRRGLQCRSGRSRHPGPAAPAETHRREEYPGCHQPRERCGRFPPLQHWLARTARTGSTFRQLHPEGAHFCRHLACT